MASKTVVAGSVGSVLFAGGAFPSLIRLIDQISRLETVVGLKPYLDLFSTPVSIGCLILGPCLVWYAISSEHKKDIAEAKRREHESGPRIWTPQCNWRPDEEPPPLPPPPVNWLWLKVLAAFGTSAIIAVGFVFFYHQQQPAKQASVAPSTQASATDQKQAFSPAKPPSSRSKAPVSAAHKNDKSVTESPLTKEQVGSPKVSPPDNARIAESVPSNLIPQDPLKAIEAVRGMIGGIREAIQDKKFITFLVSFPEKDSTYLVLIDSLLGSACNEVPRQCYFTQEGNKSDLDRPPIKGTGKAGITIHGPGAPALARAFGKWFQTYSTSSIPPELNGYKQPESSDFIWIDIGPGLPWKQ